MFLNKRKDNKTPIMEDLRPITSVNSIIKIFELIILERLGKWEIKLRG